MVAEPAGRGPRVSIIIAIAAAAAVALVAGILVGPRVHEAVASQAEATAAEGTWYISQMHPWIVQPEPGQCPICGMDLTPVDPERFATEVSIDPVVVQNIGVREAEAVRGPVVRRLRTIGNVVYDETRLYDVDLKVSGWIREQHVASMWEPVQEGEALFELDSPELYVAQQEFVRVLASSGELTGANDLVQATRDRLRWFGVPQDRIDRLEAGATPQRVITITAPAGGVVVERMAVEGRRVQPGDRLYRIADLSQVWVEATVYEQDLAFVEPGLPVRVELESGTEALTGIVDRVYPVVEVHSRAGQVRVEVDNASGALRPGMFATVHIQRTLAEEHVLVPREAVIGTGERRVLFVSLGEGRFEPRAVALGPQGEDGLVAVLDGLSAGEEVVVSGQFLLDSESRMREALAKVMQGDLAAREEAGVASIALPEDVAAARTAALEAYLPMQEALYRGDAAAAAQAVPALRERLQELVQELEEGAPELAAPALPDLARAAGALRAGGLDALRRRFGDLSVPLRTVLEATGVSDAHPEAPTAMRCGMADGIRDRGVWLQLGDAVRNPYYGADSGMAGCAVSVDPLPMQAPGEAAPPGRADPPAGQQADGDAAAEPVAPGAAEQADLDAAPVVFAYLPVARALYRNDLAAARAAAPAVQVAADGAGLHGAMPLAAAIAAADDLDAARLALGQLGQLLHEQAAAGLVGSDVGALRVYRCGMYRAAPSGGIWLQAAGDEPHNPFFGDEHGMAACAVQEWALTPTGLQEVVP